MKTKSKTKSITFRAAVRKAKPPAKAELLGQIEQLRRELIDREVGRALPPQASPAQETRAVHIISRISADLDYLAEHLNGIENSVRGLGGSWPLPEPKLSGASAATALPAARDFQSDLEARIVRLVQSVDHARVLKERLAELI